MSFGDKPLSRSENRWAFIGVLKFLGLAVLLAACTSPESPTTSLSGLETGLSVAPEFQEFYEQNGGAPIFGFPISTTYVDPVSGRLMQYFQHLRLEYDREAGVVAVSQLGELKAPPEEEWVLVPGSPGGRQRTFPETDLVVQDAFLEFYEANGGEKIFGLPVTPQIDEGGRLVQYFENALLIWNPNAPPRFRVEVADLADTYYWQNSGAASNDFRIITSATILEADVRATVKEPILYSGEEQVLYVTVITPDSLQLVEGVTVAVVANYGDLSIKKVFDEPTDQYGQTYEVLELPGVEPGDKVEVEIQATGLAGVLGKTMLSFKTWW